MLGFLNALRRPKRPAKLPAGELWRIDLGPVDEPMMNGHAERISFTVNDRMALNRTKRVAAPPVRPVAAKRMHYGPPINA